MVTCRTARTVPIGLREHSIGPGRGDTLMSIDGNSSRQRVPDLAKLGRGGQGN
jgi:hypothetical protein